MTHNTLPIARQISVTLDARTHRRLEILAKRLLAGEPTLNRIDMFGPRVCGGICEAPAVFFEDHAEIALVKDTSDISLEYRSFLLGDGDDIFIIGGRRFPEFETYCHTLLGIGAGIVVEPKRAPNARFLPLSLRCARDPSSLQRLCQAAQRGGKLNIVPYIGTGNAWRLASIIASQSGAEIYVAAPPPRLTRRVNDKLWFLERVREALDPRASPLTYSIFGPAALAARLRSLAARYSRVVVKIPDSAGSLGNVMIRSELIAGRSLNEIRQGILDLLVERGWPSSYPLLVGVWDFPVIASPSVNVWVPRREEGPPIIEGVFTQAISGDEGEFVGAEPSHLPRLLEQRIVTGAACLAQYFQNLGYFGQCGFDAILIGDSLENASLHWLECNGRWGGVSIPITIGNRLVGNSTRKSVIIVQRTNLSMPPRSLQSILEMLEGHLFGLSYNQEGVVLLAPGKLINGTGLNLLIIADTERKARHQLETVTRLLTNDRVSSHEPLSGG